MTSSDDVDDEDPEEKTAMLLYLAFLYANQGKIVAALPPASADVCPLSVNSLFMHVTPQLHAFDDATQRRCSHIHVHVHE